MWQFGWMLSLIPDSILIWITYLIAFSGFILYIASKLVRWIPMMGQYKLPAELIGVILLVAGAYLFGGYGVEMSWREKVRELEEKVKVAEAKSQEVKIQIQEKIVYKTKVVEKVKVEIQERIKVEREIIDANCVVPPEAIDILNKAAEEPKIEEKK